MKINGVYSLLFLLLLLFRGQAQLPFEVFGGHQKTTLDLMFFKYFGALRHNPGQEKERWLFFNRNRASVDYRMTHNTFLPQFGFTEAFSYNHQAWRGLAPVALIQVLNTGLYPKAGLQYARIKNHLTLFTWLVTELVHLPKLDYFILLRWMPKLNGQLNWFTQLESINTIATERNALSVFTQRLRIGVSLKGYQVGAGGDLTQSKTEQVAYTRNLGAFIRHEF